MDPDVEIDRLRRQLAGLTGAARTPLAIDLARRLCDRWVARGPATDPADLVEGKALLREARTALRPGDVWRAQVSGILGVLISSTTVGHASGRVDEDGVGQDRHELDEAVDCLAEAINHPDQPRANLEQALVYGALVLVVRALPSGDLAGLSPGAVNPLDLRSIPQALSYLNLASRPARLADLDQASAYLDRLAAMPPVNRQFHEMGAAVRSQIGMIRALLGGGMADHVATLPRLAGMWSGRDPRSAGLSGPELMGVAGLPQFGAPAVTAAAAERAVPPRPLEESMQPAQETVIDVAPEDEAAVLAFAREQGVQSRVDESSARSLEPVTAVALVLLGSARALGAVLDFVERRKGGQVIDLSAGSTPLMYRSKDLEYGLVLILTPDGRVDLMVHEPGTSFARVIEAVRTLLTELADYTSEAIAAGLEKIVGDRATVRHKS